MPTRATRCAEALEFLDAIRAEGIAIRWFEEPTRWHADFRGLRDVRMRGNVDVAAGQSEISRVGMREMMAAGAIDVCNYDASWGGGPTEWRRIAALASAFDVQLGHHEEAQVASHLLASQPHGTYVEAFSPARDPIFWQMIENRPALVDGAIPAAGPPGPGLGARRGVHREVPRRSLKVRCWPARRVERLSRAAAPTRGGRSPNHGRDRRQVAGAVHAGRRGDRPRESR